MENENKPVEELSSAAPAAEKEPTAKKKLKINTRNLKYGTLSVVLTVVFIAVIVLINVIVGIISERIDTSADLSDEGIYTISEKTENFVAGLDTDVTITVLNSETDFEALGQIYKQVNEMLKKIEMGSSHISLKYLVLDQNPNYSAQFKDESLQDNYIVIEGMQTGRHRVVTPYEYFTFNEDYLNYYGSYYVEGSNIEQAAISAMMYVTNDDPVRVAFTEGYGEQDCTALQTLLKQNGYDIETLNLTNTAEVDAEIDYVVMYAPAMDVDNEQLMKLDRFLDNGGAYGKTVLYFASAQQPETPNIEAFLNDWGLSVGYSVIGQSNSQYLMSSLTGSYVHFQQINDTDYAGDLTETTLYTYGADIRPVIQLWDEGARGGVEQEVLMSTYDGAYLYPLNADEDWDYSTAESGVFNDVVVARRIHSTNQQLSRLVVFGSELFADQYFMQYSNSNNQDFFINMFNFISGKEQGVTITPKSFSYTGFDMNEQQATILGIVLCIIIPIVVIVLGIVIWVRRRHR